MPDKTDTLAFLRSLGTVADLLVLAEQKQSGKLPANTHIHLPPNFSAFETVDQAVELAAQQGIKVLGLGNYYYYDVYEKFSQLSKEKGIFPLFGTEIIALEEDLQQNNIRINDPGNPGKYYICGKAISKFNQLSPKAAELLGIIRRRDEQRMQQMADKLYRHFNDNQIPIDLNAELIKDRITARHNCDRNAVVLQERHLCQAFQEVFFEIVPQAERLEKLTEAFGCEPNSSPDDTVGIQNEIRSHLMKAGKVCFVPETFVNLLQAKELICELGGIPCYPVLADGAKAVCQYETPIDTLIDNLNTAGFSMVEFIPARNSPEALKKYATALRKAGFAVVAGTEHNTLDMLPIEPACINSQPIPRELEDIFWEGTCVLAAHQFLRANDENGFVDIKGNANTDFSDREKRIEHFRKLGAAVIAKYLKTFDNNLRS